jgi:phosphohistidine phosphatase SixA
MLHALLSLSLAAGLAIQPADSAELRRAELMAALRSGGYTVMLRHARTDRSFQEEMASVPKERSAQRNLNDDGIRDAALMGVVFKRYGITFGEIISSPMYRAVETAEMASGTPTTTMALRIFPSTAEQAALVRQAPKPGTNRLIVTHHFVIETHVPGIRPGDVGESEAAVVRIETHVPGIRPGDVGESEAAVIRHLPDGGIELVGRITLDDWRMLANPSAPRDTTARPAVVPPHGSAPYAAPSQASVKLPETHAGHLAGAYIAAFNTGSPVKMRAFMEATMLADPARPLDERIESYAKLFGDFGSLTITSIEESEASRVVLGASSKRGSMRVTVTLSEAQAMRIASVTFAVHEGGGTH